MSWAELGYRGLRVRPWDGPIPKRGDRYAPFRASFSATVRLLVREMDALNAKNIVIELDVREQDIRLDGYPRANARPVSHPAVRVDFESKFGPVRMETCEFSDWQDNLRAIALSLESLRRVDRYGVSKRGEQYRGWRALPMSTDAADAIVTREQAIQAIHRHVEDLYDESDVDGPHVEAALREALRRTHPDRGGDSDEFRQVVRAREVLGV